MFSVLVACPKDVQQEAALVRKAVEEINRGLASLQAARLEVVNWQTHASPGIGSDAQDVINRQLPQDYDIFLGVMWARFGTATPRAGSGTEEEFERALVRYKNSPNDVKILFYFKQAALSPDAIDPQQLQKVKEFRQRLEQEGVLYGTFESSDDFERELRGHLQQQLHKLLATSSDSDARGGSDSSVGVPEGDGNENEEDEKEEKSDGDGDGGGEELGFLDYLDAAEEQFAESRAVSERMAEAIRDFGDKMRQRTKEIDDAKVDGQQLSRSEARALFEKAAGDMNHFAEMLNKDLPRFRGTLADGVAATREAAWLIPDGPERDAQLKKVVEDLGVLRDGLGEAIDGMVGFQGSVQDLPRMTKTLNLARRKASTVLAEVLDAMKGGRHLVLETIALIESKVSNVPLEAVE